MSAFLDKEDILNIDSIKKIISQNLHKLVEIKVYGMRGKISTYTGTIHAVYPNLFTVLIGNQEKSFTYRDIITKDISIKYM